MKNVEIFESVTAKRTFCVKQFFFGQKLSSKEPLQKPRVQPLLFFSSPPYRATYRAQKVCLLTPFHLNDCNSR